MRESNFQKKLIKELNKLYPGCVILKNDASYWQGIPDLLILYKKHWAMLEVKASAKASHRPNQDRLVSKLNKMSFASFIYPENKSEVLHALQRTFRD